jgi:hypothetical protein
MLYAMLLLPLILGLLILGFAGIFAIFFLASKIFKKDAGLSEISGKVVSPAIVLLTRLSYVMIIGSILYAVYLLLQPGAFWGLCMLFLNIFGIY